MTKTLSASDLEKLAETQEKEKQFILDVAKQVRSGAKVLARLSETAKGKTLKIYTYDRYLYRYICSDKIEII